MNKKGKKSGNWIVIAFAAALLSLVAIAYASGTNTNHASGNNMMDMMGGNRMEQMHKQMTKNLEPELKKQMDEMHEECEKLHEGSFEESMMR